MAEDRKDTLLKLRDSTKKMLQTTLAEVKEGAAIKEAKEKGLPP